VYLNSRRTGSGATAFEVGKDERRGERWREVEGGGDCGLRGRS
jgi:hypothetical protein